MQNNQIESKMRKQMPVSLQSLEWFILYGFLKNILEDETHVKNLFESKEDCQAVEAILLKIQNQFAPTIDDNTSDVPDIEELLNISPKKILTKTKGLIF